ncbi:MAG: hypothetical protein HN352_16910 [Bacteroidetes bacterium]|jgi:hypothetical protein|nr:hypothetical protein [Bacteroidota bacterium]MBT3748389.1 hypothetical protein [Bacteroidota bacterium]MBT4410409.1 hypothetical protein [Bacteroidota bacterium]MBT7464016.1 hypothetical protein [Bacteroidota bacterium]
MTKKIRRNLVLKQLDIKENSDGTQVVFSIVFITKQGQRVFLPRAIVTGLPYSVSIHRQRGILPVDQHGDKTGHVYPVGIDNLIEFNSMEVML